MNKDKLGIILSVGCLIHCILTPLVIPVLPLLGLTMEHEAFVHLILGSAVLIIAATTFIPGYLKHRDIFIMIAGFIGALTVMTTGIGELFNHESYTIFTISGSVILVISHYLNHKLSCECSHHHATN